MCVVLFFSFLIISGHQVPSIIPQPSQEITRTEQYRNAIKEHESLKSPLKALHMICDALNVNAKEKLKELTYE